MAGKVLLGFKPRPRLAMLRLLFFALLVQTASGAEEVFADEGGSTVLPCDVTYDPSESLFWEIVQHHKGQNIQILIKLKGQDIEIPERRYEERLSLADGNSLEISDVSRDDDSVDSSDPDVLGTYRCSQQGRVGQEWRLRVRHRPDHPSDLKVHDINPYSFDVTFKPGDDGGYPQTPYVRVRQTQGMFRDYTVQNENGELKFHIRHPTVHPNTTYDICAASENSLGISPCAWATVTTDALSSSKVSLRLVNEPYISPDLGAEENRDLLERVRNLARNLPFLVWRGLEISTPEVLRFRPGRDEANPRSVIVDLEVTAGQSRLTEVKAALWTAIRDGRLSKYHVDSHYVMIDGNVTMLPVPAPKPTGKFVIAVFLDFILYILQCSAHNVFGGFKARDIVFITLACAILAILIAVLVTCLIRTRRKGFTEYIRLNPSTCSIDNVKLPTPGYFETEDLQRLAEKVDKIKVVFVHGPSGSGKTEAANKIAESFQLKNPSHLTWFFGGTKDDHEGLSEGSVDEDLRELANELDQPTDRESALVDIVYDALNALAATGVKILLIFDDVQNISVVPREFLRNRKGVLKIIITTRDSNLHQCNGHPFASHVMRRFSDDEVVAFMNPNGNAVVEDRSKIVELGHHFDGRPFGLSLAKSHILAVGTNVTRYLEKIRIEGTFDEQLNVPEQRVYNAVALSVNNRMSENEGIMLKMAGFLMQNNIPIPILDHAYERQFGTNPSTDEFVKALKSLSLGKIQEDNRSCINGSIHTLTVHRQTQAALKRMVSNDQVETMLEALIKAFLMFFNKDTRGFQASACNSRLLPHVEALLSHPMIDSIREKAAFKPALARLYDVTASLYIKRQQPEKAKEMMERAKEICMEICPSLGKKALDDQACSELVKIAEKSYNNDVYAQQMTCQLLTYPNVKVLRAELHDRGRPKLLRNISFNAKQCQPLREQQVKKLVKEGAAVTKDVLQKSFLVELVANVYRTSGQRVLCLADNEKSGSLRDAEEDFAVSMKLSDYIAEHLDLFVLNKMLCRRDGTLLLLQEAGSKTVDQQKADLHKAITGYRELFQDPTDYFENGILKKTDQDDYHAMICFRFMVQCYRKLIPLASTDKERQELIDHHNESANNMVKFAEEYKGYDVDGNVVEVFKALPEVYIMRGEFLVKMCEQGLKSGSVKTALEDAKKWFLKALKVHFVTPQQKAKAYLGMANVYVLSYERKGRKRENLVRAEKELKNFTSITATLPVNKTHTEMAAKLKLKIKQLLEGSVSVAMLSDTTDGGTANLETGELEMVTSV
ncbi:uncharacterized protein LOC144866819 [Branchiostoma floridae x Branchiostoma japonicum]